MDMNTEKITPVKSNQNQVVGFEPANETATIYAPRRVTDWSPPVVIDQLPIASGAIHVAREDLLPGGSKQRGVFPFLMDLIENGFSEVVYATPFCGFAQVALSLCGQALGFPVRIFCERDKSPDADPNQFHSFSKLAGEYGAKLSIHKSLQEAECEAQEYVKRGNHLAAGKNSGVYKIPLGFNEPRFVASMAVEIRREYQRICTLLGEEPKRIWLPVGSGTLARIFSQLVDSKTTLMCVDVHVLPSSDRRIFGLRDLP